MKTLSRQLKIEALALRRTFSFHADNSDIRKFLLFVLVVTWSSITVGIAYQAAQVTPVYSMLTALIWALVGRLWGGNVKDISSGFSE